MSTEVNNPLVRRWIEEDNKALVRRWIEEINKGDKANIDEFIATNYVHHDPATPEVCNLKHFKQRYTESHNAFPGACVTIEDMIAEGSRVVAHLTWSDIQKGCWSNMPPTDKEVTFTTTSTFCIAGGKIVEFWLDGTVSQEKKKRPNALLSFSLYWFIPLGALVIIAARIIWPSLLIDAITLGLLIVVILPWLSKLIESAKFPGGWELTFRRIQEEQVQQKTKIETQQSEIDTLKFLISHFLTEFELMHIENFVSSRPFLVRKDGTTPNFISELQHLFALGFITRVSGHGFRTLLAQLQSGQYVDVKAHFRITEIGEDYLDLRRQTGSETSEEKDLVL